MGGGETMEGMFGWLMVVQPPRVVEETVEVYGTLVDETWGCLDGWWSSRGEVFRRLMAKPWMCLDG